MLMFGAWFFVPQSRMLIVLGAGIAVVSFLIYIGWLVTRKRPSQTFDRKVDLPQRKFEDSLVVPKPTLLEQLRNIDWFQFEKLIGLIYESRGFKVKRLGGANPDGGVDLTVESGSERFVIQCKQWNKWTVGVRQIREFLGTLTDTGISKGVFITVRGYTDDAKSLAQKHGIRLLEEHDIVTMIEEATVTHRQKISKLLNDKRKFCPKCEREMIKQTARKGNNLGKQFWGCSGFSSNPRCRFTMPIEQVVS